MISIREQMLTFVEEIIHDIIQNSNSDLNQSEHEALNITNQVSEDIPKIYIEESNFALKEMRNNRAPGEDVIVIESTNRIGSRKLKIGRDGSVWRKPLFSSVQK